MSTARFSAIPGTTTLALFKAWGSPVSAALASFGWVQTNDTGQVQWTAVAVTITGTQLTSNVATYTCSSTTGLRIGQSITVAGITNNASTYNITGVITALTSSTFSLAKTASDIAYTADAGTGTVAALAAVPDTGSFSYDIWKMGDTLQSSAPVYMKVQYGMMWNSANKGPAILVSIGTGSNGSGTLLNSYGPRTSFATYMSSTWEGSTAYDCLLSGATNRFTMLMWRDGAWPFFFSVERIKDTDGSDTASGAVLTWVFSWYSASSSAVAVFKGIDQMSAIGAHLTDATCIPVLACSATTTLANTGIAVFPLFPPFGGIRTPLMNVMSGKSGDYAELDQFSYNLYTSVAVNYIVSKLTNTAGSQQNFGGYGTNNAIIMRYD